MAVALPWLVLHVPVGAAPVLAQNRTSPAVGVRTSMAGPMVDGISWSMSGSLVIPPLTVTPPAVKHRDVIRYRAVQGDTLRALASTYGLSVNTLVWSNTGAVDRLAAGQEILIPPVDGVLVTVQPSDSVDALARKYRAESDAVIEFNFLEHPERLVASSYLMIPYGVGPEPPAAPPASPHKVAAGHRAVYVTPIYSAGVGTNYPFGQCTWYVNTRRPAPWGGNAWQWYGRAKAWGRPAGSAPRVGAIMVTWESPYWGHVAYVEQVYSDGSWLVSEMNYYSNGGGWGRISYRHVIPGTIPLIGFIY
jgi:surface antigen/LysM repeat protein